MGKVAVSAVLVGLVLAGCTTPASTSASPDAQAAVAAPPLTTASTASTAAATAATATAAPPGDSTAAAASPPDKPGLVDARGSAPVDKVIAAFGVRAKAVATCARHVPDAPMLLRVRAEIVPQGRATSVVTDPGVPLPAATQSCVEAALRNRPFALATPEGMTVTYVYAFSDR